MPRILSIVLHDVILRYIVLIVNVNYFGCLEKKLRCFTFTPCAIIFAENFILFLLITFEDQLKCIIINAIALKLRTNEIWPDLIMKLCVLS